MRKAVLFDVGGPIDCETAHEQAMDADIRSALAAAGISVSDEAFTEACRAAVDSFAPNTYQAIVWRLAAYDPLRASAVWDDVSRRAQARDLFELRAGMPDLLATLARENMRLGLVANQPARLRRHFESAGIARFFDAWALSETAGMRKPDPRLFLAACDALGVTPADCIMVGDRIDNDIAPARLLGMRTICFRTGRHIHQRPRSWAESPDREVHDVGGLHGAIGALRGD